MALGSQKCTSLDEALVDKTSAVLTAYCELLSLKKCRFRLIRWGSINPGQERMHTSAAMNVAKLLMLSLPLLFTGRTRTSLPDSFHE